ncbi:VOC family protein [Williamsia deligens]|uniref:VOC family protein n=1 Tax=Williamsia deligens TaxID=321325 RepID=A0ABW3G649_9NOCA|nr:VOC family protein [Williamsia deligens]MCP2193666.1 Glyoxalase/Bleomycin resistance protein/Dioxygenase superfamily protein [Williamsia deligens]
MTVPVHDDPHVDLHSEWGALHGEHADRAANPVIKVDDIAWLEFDKPDLDRAERFGRDFGFAVALRTPDELHLRGTWSRSPCIVIRRAPRSRFVGPVFRAHDLGDLRRLAAATDAQVSALPTFGGHVVALEDPSGLSVRVVAGVTELPSLPDHQPMVMNSHGTIDRVNAVQRRTREPARIQRLGHVVLETPRFVGCLDWYQELLGLIVSDFLYFPGQRDRGPTMAFMRCDRGSTPADHHTLAMTLGPRARYVHSAYQVADIDAIAAGGLYLADRGYHHSWGIGRHIQGSQVFDYWRDPDRFMVEHFADGDMFDASVSAGWTHMSASGLAQWGPPVTRDFLGAEPDPDLLRGVLTALRDTDNEFDLRRLFGLMKVARS